MIHRCFRVFSLACCGALIAAVPLRAEQQTSAGPACLYASKAYSDGAFICVQKSLMLSCASDGTRAVWKIVADRDLSERCVAPTTLVTAPGLRRHSYRVHGGRPRIEPAAGGFAKCFHFNGKRYCE